LFSEDFSKFFAASGTIRHFRVGIQVEGNILSATEPLLSQFVRIECEPSFYTAQHRKTAHKRFVRTCGGLLHEVHGNIDTAPILTDGGFFCLQKKYIKGGFL